MTEKRQISFLVDESELKLLDDVTLLMHDDAERVIQRAKKEGAKFRLKFSYDELDEFLDFIAAEANHAESKKKEDKLDNLYDRLQRMLELSELVKKHGKAKILKNKPTVKGKVYVFDIWINDKDKTPHKPLRKIGIFGTRSLYNFARVITQAFGFYFDHPFGYYSNMVSINDSSAGYELFVDIGEGPLTPHFKGVKKTKISEAFSNIGARMLFLFDYGDEWHFIVELKEIRGPLTNESLPAVLESTGKAPMQYPPCEEER
ncbi:MAG: plasmid pRiA4b ORF-3 family protein [Candidatus Omnitrophica bacterium]|nr:plasmid pRiA4b ORF-3 family protein [Candidatus Omnitrophota bacterium]